MLVLKHFELNILDLSGFYFVSIHLSLLSIVWEMQLLKLHVLGTASPAPSFLQVKSCVDNGKKIKDLKDEITLFMPHSPLYNWTFLFLETTCNWKPFITKLICFQNVFFSYYVMASPDFLFCFWETLWVLVKWCCSSVCSQASLAHYILKESWVLWSSSVRPGAAARSVYAAPENGVNHPPCAFYSIWLLHVRQFSPRG